MKYIIYFSISYTPKKRGLHTFDLQCMVDKTKNPLGLHISCNVYEIQSLVSYINQSGAEVYLEADKINTICLNDVTYFITKEAC